MAFFSEAGRQGTADTPVAARHSGLLLKMGSQVQGSHAGVRDTHSGATVHHFLQEKRWIVAIMVK